MLIRPQSQRLLLFSLLLLITTTFAIRLKLAPMPLERDEGEYAYLAQLICDGSAPYKDAYAFKFPGIYAAYTLILKFLGSTDTAIRLGLSATIIATLGILYFLTRKTLANISTSALYAVASYAILSLGSSFLGLSANAEHFVILPALMGFLLLTISPTTIRILLSGICFGIAVSMKQQGAAFIVGAVALFFYDRRSHFKNKPALLNEVKIFTLFALGIFIPIITFFLWIQSMGAWNSFVFWCFSYARFYGSMWSLMDAVNHFASKFGSVALETLPILALSITGLYKAWKGNRRCFWITTILLSSGFLATTPGLIFRPHYFIFILPGCALATAFAFQSMSSRWKWLCIAILFYPLILQRDLFFFKNPEDASRILYPRNAFPEARTMAEWVEKRTSKSDRFAVLGSEPQIYFYAHRHASIPHIYMYPLLEPQPYAEALQEHLMEILEKNPPKLIVHVRVPNSWIAYSNSELKLIRWIPNFLNNYNRITSITAPAVPHVTGERELILYERK